MTQKATGKRMFYLLGTVLPIVMIATVYAAQAAETINHLAVPPGLASYAIAVAQGQLISKKTGIQVIVQATQGPRVIPRLLESGDGQVATASSMTYYFAYAGTEDFTKPIKMLRVLQSGNDAYFATITREDTGIKTIRDLKGKRVTFMVTASPEKQLLEEQLKAYGLDPAKDVVFVKAEDTAVAVRELAQKRTDAVPCALTGSKIVELATKTKIVVLPFEAEKVPLLQNRLPTMYPAMTPGNLAGIDPGVPVVVTPQLFGCRADLSDDLAYQMVKALIENYNDLKAINPIMADWKPEVAVRELPIPYHPGAIKYYKEKGLWSSKMDQLQQKLLGK